MTNKQFVKSIYPRANCKLNPRLNPRVYALVNEIFNVYENYDKYSSYTSYTLLAWGSSQKQAWANAADFIQKEMIKILKSE